MPQSNERDAWVEMPAEAEIRRLIPPGGPYDFGFLPAMSRLVLAHPRIGPLFGALFGQIMFAAGGFLDRRERELVAGVAAAAQDCHY